MRGWKLPELKGLRAQRLGDVSLSALLGSSSPSFLPLSARPEPPRCPRLLQTPLTHGLNTILGSCRPASGKGDDKGLRVDPVPYPAASNDLLCLVLPAVPGPRGAWLDLFSPPNDLTSASALAAPTSIPAGDIGPDTSPSASCPVPAGPPSGLLR